jgi:hypothetical protein
MRFARRLLCLSALVAMTSLPAQSTMLIIIYTPDGYWIGADSARVFHSKRVGTVCKVHKTKWGLVLKAGTSEGTTVTGKTYSTDVQLKKFIDDAANIEDFKQSLKSQYVRDIDAELTYILNDPNVTAETIEQDSFPTPIPENFYNKMDRIILLVPDDDDAFPSVTLTVAPHSEALTGAYYGKFRYEGFARVDWTPVLSLPHAVTWGDGERRAFPDSVQIFATPIEYDKPNSWVISHPQEAILEMLNIGHTEDSEGIGPPYVILHVTKTKTHKKIYHWVSKKPCDSWTSDVTPDSILDKYRNPPT